VSQVWIQLGTDLAALESGLSYLEATAAELNCPLQTFASIFLPTRSQLARFKFRPWNGVLMSDAYLSSPETASQITRDILTLLGQHGVTPFIETAVKGEAEMLLLQNLLPPSSMSSAVPMQATQASTEQPASDSFATRILLSTGATRVVVDASKGSGNWGAQGARGRGGSAGAYGGRGGAMGGRGEVVGGRGGAIGGRGGAVSGKDTVMQGNRKRSAVPLDR
jgi:hypothetical protein